MQTQILDGISLSRTLREEWRMRAAALTAQGHPPGLSVLIVGQDPASSVYVRNKIKACAEVGLRSEQIELPEETSETELLQRIRGLNADPAVHGILVQLPLPKHISGQRVLTAIAPEKDVDGFHPTNVGLLATGSPRFAPCTPAGVMALLEAAQIDPWGKHAVVVGASNIVGKPVAHLLLQKGATITLCNSKTVDLAAHTRQADILIVAIGKPKLITGDMIKKDAVVVDVGINRLADGSLAGDVDYASMLGIASHITPVPGGVGPMTITMLIINTIRAAEAGLPRVAAVAAG
ncbi:MAG TPA: bifunctional methylenetetrahydrofolate dehydrogenase/methenyltetrahydrofolate cyclohydrolase FolD [Burkholderiales bacterium]|nr:bifunctional methylenetetrahydrofolate dehydrogenase/methenyltetrahydrofolate cyclohydrolase FolD [Burkholderiales bacterium]